MSTAEAANTDNRVMTGADIVVKSLVDHGVDVLFAYPGGCSMPIHQALTRFGDSIRTILPRHEQGGGFAAQGYARATGRVGVVMATSGPGATNLVTAIADAKLDSIPMVCLTAQVPTKAIGSDAFQETPMVEVCRGITKHHYLVTSIDDLPRVMKEAFHVASSGRPGPVLVDLPKDVQLSDVTEVDLDPPMDLPGYEPAAPAIPAETVRQIAAAIKLARRPVIYSGGGVILGNASEELREFINKTGIPTVTTIMGIGSVPPENEHSLDWLGMHGAAYANYAVRDCDLLIALGVRFDDRVTGKVEAFAKDAKIIHIDIDGSELNKNKEAHIPVRGDVKQALTELNKTVTRCDIDPWRKHCTELKAKYPFTYDTEFDGILQQHAIQTLSDMTASMDTQISVGVGQHQMWAAQFYKFRKPRTWHSSSGLGTMGFGLPAAMGIQAALPDSLVIDIDGDGSFQMNIQELATCFCEELPVKVFLLNNQHLGMVVQWEDRFMDRNRAHTYLGPISHDEASGNSTAERFTYATERYPNFVQIAKGYGCGAATVRKKADLEGAIKEMIEHKGPYLLDVEVPYQEHVLPMIPGGMTVDDMIMK
ncbi:biosynthetic-type acetolactate synthase large subunit [Stieleria sp. JC731]|uniref:biosynthetic-type acetolactate synthase large subunit n=1 Tax=Pirellulaceae TaxID=2691357 RepID=UPI001E36B7DE|nr:biosynthetic-type acetolactate synthase large subunit [Stieleria sp. JC731]MCC9600163.1 biosynthetic-type acetolactate synthase large subunit [Stieleria sp. JC731]